MFNGGIVLVDYGLAFFLEVGIINSLLHSSDSLFNGDDTQQLKECSLQNGIGPVAQPDAAGDGRGINGVETGFFLR